MAGMKLGSVHFMSWGKRTALALLVAPLLLGCVRSAQVRSEQLPVTRVVVYRNGVAYFERQGQVDSEQVHFQLRQENVGDFLATLAVLERGGHTVRAASFPVKMDEDDEAARVDPELQAALDRWDNKKSDPRELRKVTLELDGKKHDLSVGYLAETPLWRPSYRLVVGGEGDAVFQAWGIVQNQSGEDWVDVEIALVAGAPIAFESTLGQPIVPQRPVVTDSGEVISAVPEGSTSYHQEEAAPPPAPEADMAAEEARAAAEVDDESGEGPGRRSKSAVALGSGGGYYGYGGESKPIAAPAPAQADYDPTPRDGSGLARVELQTGATRYEVPHRVTIPDQSATMVLFVSKKVPGEAVFLYAPDGGVPDSYTHPFRVARFKNKSGGMLERGPIAVFEKGAFLGQGVVDALPNNAQATVPFALMRSLSIRKEVRYDQRGGRLYAVREGRLTIERDQATISEYTAVNGDGDRVKLLVRHARSMDSKLHEPPKGTEELNDQYAALVPVDVPAHGKAKLLVEERRPIRQEVEWQSPEARTAISDYLKGTAASAAEKRTLEIILKHASALSDLQDKERKLKREQAELEKSTRETRLSLQAIEKNQQAAELRRELTVRLTEGTRRLDEITKDLVEVGLRRSEQEVRLKEAQKGLNIAPQDKS